MCLTTSLFSTTICVAIARAESGDIFKRTKELAPSSPAPSPGSSGARPSRRVPRSTKEAVSCPLYLRLTLGEPHLALPARAPAATRPGALTAHTRTHARRYLCADRKKEMFPARARRGWSMVCGSPHTERLGAPGDPAATARTHTHTHTQTLGGLHAKRFALAGSAFIPASPPARNIYIHLFVH
eukprot:802817-Prorocentrum_minimum.AAC.1